MEVTKELVEKVLSVVDEGLSSGLGERRPGGMCVEAAVCYAMGMPHGDNPTCVSSALRAFKIALNDANWSSKKARASGMRRLAIAQLGTAGVLNDKDFANRAAMLSCTVIVPRALRAAASMMDMPKEHSEALELAAQECEKAIALKAARAAAEAAAGAARAAAGAAWAAAGAAWAAAGAAWAAAEAAATDAELAFVAEEVVKVLIDMNTPGAAWLELAPNRLP